MSQQGEAPFDTIKAAFQKAVIAYLNSLVADPVTMAKLIEFRRVCTSAMSDHQHCVCEPAPPPAGMFEPMIWPSQYQVGMLGVINGLLTSLGLQRVAVVIDDSERVREFIQYVPTPRSTVDEFLATKPEPGCLVSVAGVACKFVAKEAFMIEFEGLDGQKIVKDVDELRVWIIPVFRITESGK